MSCRKKRTSTVEQHILESRLKRTGKNKQNKTRQNTNNIKIYAAFFKSAFLFIFEGPSYENAGVSVYNTRGSQALLEEIDPDEKSNDSGVDEFESHDYVNVNMTRISLQRLWEYKLQNAANDLINTEFQVNLSFMCNMQI